jgi:undecaprenyl-diphosphatase
MIEKLESIDRWIVLTVNSWNTPFFDELMWLISQRSTWIPLYLILLILAYRKLLRREFIFFVILTIVTIALADLISVQLFKNIFLRYRPSHHSLLAEKLHFYMMPNNEMYKGGMYGFVSSHAANFFALGTFVGLALRQYYPRMIWIMFFIASTVSFSRLYQGVHYLSDLFVGGLLGALIAFLIYRFVYKKLKIKRLE